MELSQLLLLYVLLRSNSRCHRPAVPFANEAPERGIGRSRWSTEHLPCREGTRTLANDGVPIALALMRALNCWVSHTYEGPAPTAEPRQTNKRWGKERSPARELLGCIRRFASVRRRSRDAIGIESPIALGTDPPSPPVPPLSRSMGDAGAVAAAARGAPAGHGWGSRLRGESGSAPEQVRGRGRAVRAVAAVPGRAIRRRSTTGGQPHLKKTTRPGPSAVRTGLSPHRMRRGSAAGGDFS